jgi:8-oxo-dGTP diphosphatase
MAKVGAMGDGDGWARCERGHLHWGRYGAAGLLAFHRDAADGEPYVLLQQRAWWCSGGGTWGMFGGGRHSHEGAIAAALRETAEESTLSSGAVRVYGLRTEDHGGWKYTSVVGAVAERVTVRPASMETRAARWVRVDEVDGLRLFPPFAASWPPLRAMLSRPVLVVDAANVVGARADGWWRDRAGATARLRDELMELAAAGVTGLDPYELCFPEIVLVVEGAARAIPARAAEPRGTTDTVDAADAADGRDGRDGREVRIIRAERSGDDAIVEVVSAVGRDAVCWVVTADRELRSRCTAAGAQVIGPRRLLDQLGRPPSATGRERGSG